MSIIEEYNQVKEEYLPNVIQIEQLLISLLKNNSINFHSVQGRLKEKSSLEEKIIRKEGKYNDLSEITDIIGLRIITYTENIVDEIKKLLENEFIVDIENSVDKRKKKPNEFGYLSVHLIVQLNKERATLCEYSQLKNLRFEIQIRSILQHAWAEIEHDIGYKNHEGIPEHLQRDFFRIASLLELADKEFISLLKNTNIYEKDVVEMTKSNNLDKISLDSISLLKYLDSELVTKLDSEIVEIFDAQYISELQDNGIERHISRLNYFNITTLAELENLLIINSDFISFIASELKLTNSKIDIIFSKGISLFYLSYSLLKDCSKEEIKDYMEKLEIDNNSEESAIKIKKVIDKYKSQNDYTNN